MKSVENLMVERFEFQTRNGSVGDGSIRNVFKPANEKKEVVEIKSETANRGARLSRQEVIDKLLKLAKSSD